MERGKVPMHREQTARKTYRCGWECGSKIEPGTFYVRSALPPMTDPNYSEGWWVMTLHGHDRNDCPTYSPDSGSESLRMVDAAESMREAAR